MPDDSLRLIVLARDQSLRVQDAWRDLAEFLAQQHQTEVVAAAITEDLEPGGPDADLVVVLGGDGAILRACRQLGMSQLPILGINLGRLGFLADLSPEEFRAQFPQIHSGDYRVVEHLMFECRIIHADGSVDTHLGLNETAILSAGSLRMLDIELEINSEQVTTYSCDGLLVSTPVGSTAHNLSAGGPILRQELRAFVITPICPHTLTNRPLVDDADHVYRMTVPNAQDGVAVVIDGQISQPLRSDDAVEIRKAPITFKLAKVPGTSYYTTLHRKLGWGGQPKYRQQ